MLARLKYFICVAETGSFSEAAEKCHISQSAISQQIQSLERELKVKLIARRNRGFSLTPAEEYFYRRGASLLCDYEKILKETGEIASDKNFKLHIGYLASYGGNEFNAALTEFARY